MAMLNYLGAGTGPGTMPSAIPGSSRTADLLGSVNGPSSGPLPPALAQAIRPANPAAGPAPIPQPPGPADTNYEAVTQEDGSILLHIKNPDGSIGPAVKIINPIKPRQQ